MRYKDVTCKEKTKIIDGVKIKARGIIMARGLCNLNYAVNPSINL